MARTQTYTEEEIVAALRETKGMVFLAAQRVGCNPDTIYERAKTSEAIHEVMRAERGKVVDTAELKLHSAMMRGEPWAIRMVLTCLGRTRGYGDCETAAQLESPPTKPGMSREEIFRIARDAASQAVAAEPDWRSIVIEPPTE